MCDTEKMGKALIAAGEVLVEEGRKRRYRERRQLGPDWQTWPVWAQKELLKYLRSLDKPAITN